MRRVSSIVFVLALGCGARTGLDVPEGGVDAGTDDGMDAFVPMPDAGPEPDAGVDAGPIPETCAPRPVPLARRRVEVLFLIDRSSSMTLTPDGEETTDPETNRWSALRDALGEALIGRDAGLGIGAIFFPDTRLIGGSIEANCTVVDRTDLEVAPNNAGSLLEAFAFHDPPMGATPTAEALRLVRTRFTSGEDREVARFVVLATDGAPNCNPEPAIGPPDCICTSTDSARCDASEPFAAYSCLDDAGAIDALLDIREDAVPVYVIGISDPMRPEFSDVLDRMAEAGGRPRPLGARRFYDVRDRDDLAAALGEITDSIQRCTFYLPVGWRIERVDRLEIGGRTIARDPLHRDGWDLTDAARGEVSLYGSACDEGAADGAVITALPVCEE